MWRPHPLGILIFDQHNWHDWALDPLRRDVLRFWGGRFEILFFVIFLVLFGLRVSVTVGCDNQPCNSSSLGVVSVPGGLSSRGFCHVGGANALTPLLSWFLLSVVGKTGNVGDNLAFALLFWCLGIVATPANNRHRTYCCGLSSVRTLAIVGFSRAWFLENAAHAERSFVREALWQPQRAQKCCCFRSWSSCGDGMGVWLVWEETGGGSSNETRFVLGVRIAVALFWLECFVCRTGALEVVPSVTLALVACVGSPFAKVC